jgi:hypothetical protein
MLSEVQDEVYLMKCDLGNLFREIIESAPDPNLSMSECIDAIISN